MAWNSNLRKGTDLPTWDWLSMFPTGLSSPGSCLTYDGFRYIYASMQTGSTSAGTASTTNLWKYDTWTDAWQLMISTATSSSGGDIEYDPVRNVLYTIQGASTTTWRTISLNSGTTLANGNTQISAVAPVAYTETSITPALTTASATGSSIALVEDVTLPAVLGTGTVALGTSSTVFSDQALTTMVNPGHAGCAIRFTSGTNSGLRRTITSVATTKGQSVFGYATGTQSATSVTLTSTATAVGVTVGMSVTGNGIAYGAFVTSVSGSTVNLSVANVGSVQGNLRFFRETLDITLAAALTATPSSGDTFVLELPTGTATATFNTTTLADSTQNWITNIYRDSDVVIVSGTGAGQRRRIASNTATVLTLASAVTGNTRTGVWTTTPDATSVYQIVPSSDYLYYAVGNSGTLAYRIDVNTNTSAATWGTITAPPNNIAAGGPLVHGKQAAPFSLFLARGGSTVGIFRYDIGLQTWTQINGALGGSSNTFLGSVTADMPQIGSAMVVLFDKNRLAMFSAGTNRIISMRLADAFIEGIGTVPYSAPAAYEGRRMRYVMSVDGVDWLYLQRAGGGEFFRCAIEHL
jgi:hypothetical protein